MERSNTENRSAFAEAIKRRDGAMRGMLGMGPEPDNVPGVDEQAAGDRFRADLVTMLPRLRIYAMSLTHNSDSANDLVQQTVLNSMAGRRTFRPGTNFSGWLFRIQRNEFISGLRRQRPTVNLDDDTISLSHKPPLQETGLIMREFTQAFRVLPSKQRKALLLTALEGHSHKRIAAHSSVSVGAVKSRVSRARATLRHLLGNDVPWQ
jgi:RNA polymerase sigma-70 factor (ECF subfamily)